MNFFSRELINRIINYLIKVSRGDSYEEKIEQLLRKSLLITFMAFLFAATMTSKFLVANWYLGDLEKSISKIDQFMGTQQENISQLFRINAEQYSTLQSMKRSNQEMRQDLRLLVQQNARLEKENGELRGEQEKRK